MNALGS
ncbi:hypothetical protein S7711_11630 [Stachybotrys chartarum IBT 7711]|nr:hypothetical protein S7711_11630 [Stachybotrys chartarum IBT 7711]